MNLQQVYLAYMQGILTAYFQQNGSFNNFTVQTGITVNLWPIPSDLFGSPSPGRENPIIAAAEWVDDRAADLAKAIKDSQTVALAIGAVRRILESNEDPMPGGGIGGAGGGTGGSGGGGVTG